MLWRLLITRAVENADDAQEVAMRAGRAQFAIMATRFVIAVAQTNVLR